MGNYLLAEIPYQSDSSLVFDKFSNEPWSIFLDSNQPKAIQGRYDIIVSRPKIRITSRNGETNIESSYASSVVVANPFTVLAEYLPAAGMSKDQTNHGVPFAGGAMGYFSYDLGRSIERLPATATNDMQLPDMKIGIYPWAIVVDHIRKKTHIVGDKTDLGTRRSWDDLVKYASSEHKPGHAEHDFEVLEKVRSNMTENAYVAAFDKIKKYIEEGDCYQVNLAQRFDVAIKGNPWRAYCILRDINPSPFSAYLNFSEFQVLSNSPERFLSVKDRLVQTRPIKGTCPRSSNNYRDQALLQELKNSKKDQAENVMIVDLMRNDISKNCALGSVKVPKLFGIESYPNVHHMVSTITGVLHDKRDAIDLLKGCFPGGSVTGAPKLRSMEIIEELEPHRRGVYCGAIGYISNKGNMDTNIAIRTIVHKQQRMYFHAGGGIVFDSQAESEYQETFDKAAAMMRVLS